ncbi:GlcG/HbpS family heme-binding protein [Amycolatopsis pithecellobii]|uniref:Heme-binding protein n=1 Tax=Amycolatopsis pithecellobii TaxID=664692 RepID=A0A6N7YX47_9PSEU|nr:heme-binding protein [Amycolatopsis pithecellobii]MTD56458.1 heme-binding protein [Amycolatopsis pithecellobii]
MSQLTLEHAQKLSAAACDKAREIGVAMTVAIVDAGGHLVSLTRMDGAPFVVTEIAIGKAYTAASFGMPTSDVAERFADRVQFTTAIQVATQGRFMLSKGGLPIVADGRTIGGIAASGGTGEQDVTVVQAALT